MIFFIHRSKYFCSKNYKKFDITTLFYVSGIPMIVERIINVIQRFCQCLQIHRAYGLRNRVYICIILYSLNCDFSYQWIIILHISIILSIAAGKARGHLLCANSSQHMTSIQHNRGRQTPEQKVEIFGQWLALGEKGIFLRKIPPCLSSPPLSQVIQCQGNSFLNNGPSMVLRGSRCFVGLFLTIAKNSLNFFYFTFYAY